MEIGRASSCRSPRAGRCSPCSAARRPKQRPGRYANFDSFLLHQAAEEGAQVLTAEVRDIRRSSSGRPVVSYRLVTEETTSEIEADFVAFAAGVNRTPGMDLGSDPLFGALAKVMPGLRPPKVRKAAHLRDAGRRGTPSHHGRRGALRPVWFEGALHRDVLAHPQRRMDNRGAARQEHRPRRPLPVPADSGGVHGVAPHQAPAAETEPSCGPFAPVIPTWRWVQPAIPFGDRIALVGDMAVSRLYKDGLYSAYVTGSALAECILTEGVDRASLKKRYMPVVRGVRPGQPVWARRLSAQSGRLLAACAQPHPLSGAPYRKEERSRKRSVVWPACCGGSRAETTATFVSSRPCSIPASVWLDPDGRPARDHPELRHRAGVRPGVGRFWAVPHRGGPWRRWKASAARS